VDLPWFGSVTTIVVLPFVISNGFKGNKVGTAVSVLSGLASLRPWGSEVCGFISNCGCLASNSEIWTKDPFHSLTISLYGNSIPDLSDIAFENLPVALFAIMFLDNKLSVLCKN
jgi:hypothetical protein